MMRGDRALRILTYRRETLDGSGVCLVEESFWRHADVEEINRIVIDRR